MLMEALFTCAPVFANGSREGKGLICVMHLIQQLSKPEVPKWNVIGKASEAGMWKRLFRQPLPLPLPLTKNEKTIVDNFLTFLNL